MDSSVVLAYLTGDEPGSRAATRLFDDFLATGRDPARSRWSPSADPRPAIPRRHEGSAIAEGFLGHFAEPGLDRCRLRGRARSRPDPRRRRPAHAGRSHPGDRDGRWGRWAVHEQPASGRREQQATGSPRSSCATSNRARDDVERRPERPVRRDPAEDAADRAAAEAALEEYRRDGGVEAKDVFKALTGKTMESPDPREST